MMSWIRALSAEELPIGQTRLSLLDGERVVLCRVSDGEVYAIEDSCSHDDGPLGEGKLEEDVIECPRHGARFDVRTGAAVRMPAATPIETYPARISDGWIEVDLEGET